MATIDERIVQLIFDGSGFDGPANKSKERLDELDKSIAKFGGADAFAKIEQSLESVTEKFTKLNAVGIGALASLGQDIYNTLKSFTSSLTIGQINAGFNKYESSMKSVKTMMVQTGETIEQVEAVMAKALKYSDETSYDYSQMANLMATLVGSKVSIADAERYAEAISNLGAYAGKETSEMAIVYRNFGDIFAKGFLSANDYRSLNDYAHVIVPAFKEELLSSAEAFGYLEKKADGYYYTTKKLESLTGTKTGKMVNELTFKDSLQYMWAQADVVADTLEKFRYEEGKSEDSLAAKAYSAAKEYRTFGDVVMTVKDVTSTAISESFKSIFGDAEEAVSLWTAVGEKMVDIFASPFTTLAESLKQWKAGNGRYLLLNTLKYFWEGVETVFSPLSKAWHEAFDVDIEQTMYKFTSKVLGFGQKLHLEDSTLTNVKKFFDGVFSITKSILGVVKKTSSAVFKPILDFLGVKFTGFDELLGDIGTALSEMSNAIDTSETLVTVLQTVSGLISGILETVDTLFQKLSGGYTSIKNSSFGQYIGGLVQGVGDIFKGFSSWGDFLKNRVFGPNTIDNLVAGKSIVPLIAGFLVAIISRKGVLNLVGQLNGTVDKFNTKTIFIDKITEFITNLWSAVTTLVGTIRQFLGDKEIKVVDTLSTITKKVVTTFETFAKGVLYIAVAMTMIGSLVTSGSLYDALGSFIVVLSIFGLFMKIFKGIETTTKGIRGISVLSATPILIMAASLVLIAGALATLSLVNTGKMVVAGIVVSVIMNTLFKILQKIANTNSTLSYMQTAKGKGLFGERSKVKANYVGAGTLVAGIMALAISCDLIAAALIPLALVNPVKALAGGLAIVGVVAALAQIEKGLVKFNHDNNVKAGDMVKGALGIAGILVLTAALIPLALTLSTLAVMDVGKVFISALILVGMLEAISSISSAMMRYKKETTWKDLGMTAVKLLMSIAGIAALTGAAVILATSLVPLAVLPWRGITVGAAALVVSLAALASIVGVMTKNSYDDIPWARIVNVAFKIVGMYTLIPILAAVATILAGVSIPNSSKLAINSAIIIAAMAALTGLIGAIAMFAAEDVDWGHLTNIAAALLGVGALVGLMYGVALTIGLLSLADPYMLAKNAATLVTVMAGLSAIVGGIALFTKIEIPLTQWGKIALFIIGMAGVAGVMVLAGIALGLIAKIPTDGLVRAGITSGIVLAVIGVLVKALSKLKLSSSIKGILAFLAVGAAMKRAATAFKDVATGLAALRKATFPELIAGALVSIIALGSIVGAFGLFAWLLTTKFKGQDYGKMIISLAAVSIVAYILAKAVTAIIAALKQATALVNMSDIWTSLIVVIAVLGAIIGGIYLLTVALGKASVNAPAIISLAGALLTFGLACLTVAAAVFVVAASIILVMGLFYLLGAAIIYLGKQGEGLLKTVQTGAKILTSIIFNSLYSIIFGMIGGITSALFNALPVLAGSIFLAFYELITAVLAGVVLGLVNGIAVIVAFVPRLWKAITDASDKTKVSDLLSEMLDDFGLDGTLTKKLSAMMKDAGTSMTTGFTQGIGEGIKESVGTGTSALGDGLVGFLTFAGGGVQAAGNELGIDLGTNFIDGTVGEITSEATTNRISDALVEIGHQAVKKAGAGLANAGAGLVGQILNGVTFGAFDVSVGVDESKDLELYPDVSLIPDKNAPDFVEEAILPKLAPNGALSAPVRTILNTALMHAIDDATVNSAERMGDAAVSTCLAYTDGLAPMIDGSISIASGAINGTLGILMSSVSSFANIGAACGTAFQNGLSATIGSGSGTGAVKGLSNTSGGNGLNRTKSQLYAPELSPALTNLADLAAQSVDIQTITLGALREGNSDITSTITDTIEDVAGSVLSGEQVDWKSKLIGSMSNLGVDISGLFKLKEAPPSDYTPDFSYWEKAGYTILKHDDGTYWAEHLGAGELFQLAYGYGPNEDDTKKKTSSFGNLGGGGRSGSSKKKEAIEGTYEYDYNPWNKFEFTQNNYSPKSLSRIEIYRQTQNQFNSWKGGYAYRDV